MVLVVRLRGDMASGTAPDYASTQPNGAQDGSFNLRDQRARCQGTCSCPIMVFRPALLPRAMCPAKEALASGVDTSSGSTLKEATSETAPLGHQRM